MAKLLSHHDKFHVHAMLGLTALIHFLYRFLYMFTLRAESFTYGRFSFGSLLVHFLLHVSSFQFDLPANRIWTKPMIWREFRVHNAIFAYRHLVGAALGIAFPAWWWRDPSVSSLAAKIALVLAGCKAADIATDRIGSTEKRTTNAMPYPKKTDKSIESVAKWFYAKSQFAATTLAAFGTPSLSFCSILAIEIASFLMTLVRKGLIEDRTYHFIYAFSLFIMFPAIVIVLHSGDPVAELACFRAMCACFISCEMRMNYRFSKYTTWIVSLVGGMMIAEGAAAFINIKWLAWPGMIWSMVDTLVILFRASGNSDSFAAKVDGDSKYPSVVELTEEKSVRKQMVNTGKSGGS